MDPEVFFGRKCFLFSLIFIRLVGYGVGYDDF